MSDTTPNATPSRPSSPSSSPSPTSSPTPSSPTDAIAIHGTERDRVRALVQWFRTAARDLPWRRERSGWAALVSEAMLQQTQVARVVPAFERFMRRFPTPASLADADEETVLAHWQGLGYYRRARMLHAAAAVIVSDHGGVVPEDAAALRALPGVGRYTAGAIASIAFGHREPIVDGNVRRVLARLDADDRPVADRAAERDAWATATRWVEAAEDPAACNEALMELGALVCTPQQPRCDACPLADTCRARALGRTDAIPPPRVAAARTDVHAAVVVVRRGDAILLEQRPPRGLWASMWQPPTLETARALAWDAIEAALPITLTQPMSRGAFLHRTTHRDVHLHVWSARTRVRRGRWVPTAEIADVPIGNAHRRAIELVLEDRAAS